MSAISLPYSFSPNTLAQSSQVNSDFTTIYNDYNGSITDVNISSLSESKLTFTDITTGDVGTAKHGFVPKAPNDATKYLDGTGAYSRPAVRSYLAGLTLSNDGGSPNTVLDIAAGSATDGTNATLLALAAFTKTTAAFVAGTGNGALDTGAVAANTWYHVWLIGTAAGALTDILFSLSATAPTMPATYTLKRRIGSFKTAAASTNILAFSQKDDWFAWDVAVLDVNSANPGTAAVARTLTVPTGVNVDAVFNAFLSNQESANITFLFTDLALTDTAPAVNTLGLGQLSTDDAGALAATDGAQIRLRTNTSAQVRSRVSASGASTTIRVATQGWWDRRGQGA